MSTLSASATPVLTRLPVALEEVSVDLEARADPACAKYVLIATRGTNEPQAPTAQLTGMSNYTLGNITGGIAYQTVYPAGDNTQQIGADDIVRRIEQGLTDCPSQKYVLLGYSQGATATTLALTNYTNTASAGYKAIAGVLLIGNPAKLSYKISNVDQLGGSLTNSTNGVYSTSQQPIPSAWYSSKTLDICYVDDLVCNGLNFWSIINAFANHQKYYQASVQNIGAAHLIKQLKAALA
ncbi:alpha/beta-hydrolase [Microstroma glucosiphilum]|uniref:Alpha/beta-hydrolase n=1 Tax=Pseudomicrostroma glucosiphilum TaxID=1684307 RepID=A0A316TX17_9BASI|nr:alpha/beta-hydrolase [Pseudomicrostroma glucosiphilum]PWN17972.1 alpha/beta-hydrolase [Pseudomicrostroma glucosiphilum]